MDHSPVECTFCFRTEANGKCEKKKVCALLPGTPTNKVCPDCQLPMVQGTKDIWEQMLKGSPEVSFGFGVSDVKVNT